MPRWAGAGIHRLRVMGLLTAGEAAKLLRWHVDSVYAAIRTKELAAVDVGRGQVPRWRIDEAEIVRYLAAHSSNPHDEADQ
jgi:excisionase family DNA binding protein